MPTWKLPDHGGWHGFTRVTLPTINSCSRKLKSTFNFTSDPPATILLSPDCSRVICKQCWLWQDGRLFPMPKDLCFFLQGDRDQSNQRRHCAYRIDLDPVKRTNLLNPSWVLVWDARLTNVYYKCNYRLWLTVWASIICASLELQSQITKSHTTNAIPKTHKYTSTEAWSTAYLAVLLATSQILILNEQTQPLNLCPYKPQLEAFHTVK